MNRSRGFDGAMVLGIILVAVGLFFLFQQLGIISISFGSLWPFVIIGIGIWVLWQATRPRPTGETAVTVPRDGADELELRLSVGAGSFHVAGGAAELVEATSTHPDIAASTTRDGRRARVHLKVPGAWSPSTTTSREWHVRIGTDVTVLLEVDGGAGRLDLDLAGVRSVGGRIAIGAGECRLVLPQPVGEAQLKGSLGAAALTIVVPPGVEASISTRGLVSTEGRTETPGYTTAADRLRVSIDGGAASVKIA